MKKAILNDASDLVGFASDGNGPEVPDDCDLATDGRYRWDGDKFEPKLPVVGGTIDKEPDALRAIALGLYEINKTIPLPAYTKKFLKWYANSVDGS